MPVHNADIVAVFQEIADLLEILGDNPFRIRAYRNAARTVGGYGRELAGLVAAGLELPKLPGVGVDLAAKIREIASTGRSAALDRLRRRLPPAITELLRVPGLGPRRVQALHRALGLTTIGELHEAARAGRIRALEGFGEKTEQRILEALSGPAGAPRRTLLAVATPYAEALADHLRQVRGVRRVEIAGSYRRRQETVGDLDFLVLAPAATAVMERFARYDEVRTVLARGDTRASVILNCGLQADLRVVRAESWGAALHYFTGSKAHNIALRRIAQGRGLKLNEYGLFRGERRLAGATEESVYAALGLPYIAPELREDRGEIEAAGGPGLPRLVELADLRGDLHAHTKASDGKHTIREMALAAKARGLSYLAITDHSRRLAIAGGLDPQRLLRQGAEIDEVNATLRGIRVLKGSEVDILKDGTLDLPDRALAGLDVVIVAMHTHHDLPRHRQTQRLLRALDHPHARILAHPAARLLGQRPALDIDLLQIVRKAKARGVILELNSQPERLDLDDVACRMARDEGVPVAVNSDAHSTFDFGNLRYGIGQARRGWLAAGDVANTRRLPALRTLFSARRSKKP